MFACAARQRLDGSLVGTLRCPPGQAAVRFFGPMEFNEESRKLTFDFTRIELFGGALGFDLGKGGAAEIGAATGLGSENNVKLAEQGKKPFFNWIDCDDVIATARGGGGGLALWTRTDQP